MNILLTSAGRRTYIVKYLQEILKNKGKVFASNSNFSSALSFADEYIISPLIYEGGYVEFILNYCKVNEIDIVLPLFDIDLPVLSKAKMQFAEQGIEVIVSAPEVVEVCNDKWKTYNFLRKNNILTPKTYLYLEEVLENISSIIFPLIVKPRWGMGSISVYKAENVNELEIFYYRIQREIQRTYLKYESNLDIESAVLIQEFIQGKEYGLDVFNDLQGHHLKTYAKEKIEMRSGETDCAVLIKNEPLEKVGFQISNELKHVGNLDMDCFIKDEEIFVLELNCRFGGGYPFTHLSGANLLKILIDLIAKHTFDERDLECSFNKYMAKEIVPVFTGIKC